MGYDYATGKFIDDKDPLIAAQLNDRIARGGSVTLRDFGAKCDGVTDDAPAWTALAAAVAAMVTGGIAVNIPPGRTLLSTQVTLNVPANVGFALQGLHKDLCEVVSTGSASGLTINLNGDANYLRSTTVGAQGNPLRLSGFSVKRGSATGGTFAGTALTVNGGGIIGRSPAAVNLSDLRICGLGNSFGWASGIVLNRVNYPVLDDISIIFPTSDHTAGHGVGIAYNGIDTAHYATTMLLNNYTCLFGYTGLALDAFVQGVTVTGMNSIQQDYGIYQADGASSAPELLSVSQSYFYNSARCVYLGINSALNTFSNCLFQCWGTPSSWAGIEGAGANNCTITGCNVDGQGKANTDGFLFTGAGGIVSIVGGAIGALTGYVLNVVGTATQIVCAGVSASCPNGLGFVSKANAGQVAGAYQYNGSAALTSAIAISGDGSLSYTGTGGYKLTNNGHTAFLGIMQATGNVQIGAGATNLIPAASFFPGTDKTLSLGAATNRWANLFAGNGQLDQLTLTKAELRTGYTQITPVTGQINAMPNGCRDYLVDPAGTLATLTVRLPTGPADGQMARIKTTQTITALNLTDAAGGAVVGAPSSIAAGTEVTFQYAGTAGKWI